MNEEIHRQLARIEVKLDILIAALAADEDEPGLDLAGEPLPPARDPNEPL